MSMIYPISTLHLCHSLSLLLLIVFLAQNECLSAYPILLLSIIQCISLLTSLGLLSTNTTTK